MFLDELPLWFVLLTAVSVGLCVGSFLNVVIYRLPRGLNLSKPASQCPHCETPIKPYDNLPVFGWLLLWGKSRCCKKTISVRYPIVELLGGLMAAAIVYAKLEPVWHDLYAGEALLLFTLYLTLGLGLLAAAAIDLEFMILPHSITWGGAAIGLASSFIRPEVTPTESFVGLLLGYVGIWFPFIWLHKKIRGFEGMGLGDANLMALAGAWFGPYGVLIVLFAGSIQGTIAAGFIKLFEGKIKEPEAITKERDELLAAIQAAHEAGNDAELEQLEEILREDPVLGIDPDNAPGGPRIAFGPFLSLSIIELMLFYSAITMALKNYLHV